MIITISCVYVCVTLSFSHSLIFLCVYVCVCVCARARPCVHTSACLYSVHGWEVIPTHKSACYDIHGKVWLVLSCRVLGQLLVAGLNSRQLDLPSHSAVLTSLKHGLPLSPLCSMSSNVNVPTDFYQVAT